MAFGLCSFFANLPGSFRSLSNAVARLDEDEKGIRLMDTLGGFARGQRSI
jgi:hypothetical protein